MIAYAFPMARLCLAAVFLYSGVDTTFAHAILTTDALIAALSKT